MTSTDLPKHCSAITCAACIPDRHRRLFLARFSRSKAVVSTSAAATCYTVWTVRQRVRRLNLRFPRFLALSRTLGKLIYLAKEYMKRISHLLVMFAAMLPQYADATSNDAPPEKEEPSTNRSVVFTKKASTTSSSNAFLDNEFAWDEFDHRGSTVWACRGVQTGTFVGRELCKGKDKVDAHWPDKTVPETWRGE